MPYYVKGYRNKPVRTPWEVKYKMLKKYTDVHKRIPKHKELGTCLSNWMKYQRERFYLQRGSPLSENKKKLLEALPGWDWTRHNRSIVSSPKAPTTPTTGTQTTETHTTPTTETQTALAPAPATMTKETSCKKFETHSDVSKLKENEPIKSELEPIKCDPSELEKSEPYLNSQSTSQLISQTIAQTPLELFLTSNSHQKSPKTIRVNTWVISLFPKLLDHYADCNFYSSRINRILLTNKFE